MESSELDAAPQVKMRKIGRRLHITGTVQGVGFRAALCAAAEVRGLRGWVRNCRDGSVEAEVAGSPEAVQSLIAWARRGPPAAHVAALRVETIDAAAVAADGFGQRPTA
jgi:acylphosphatase